MPGKVKVKVTAGRNLPVMDKGSDTTDAYVEIKLGNVTHKTDICRKSLNPQWNSTEWYRFEVDDAELQDEPLQLRLMDHDTYSANDAIGKVYISLNPLLLPEAQLHPHHAPPTAAHSGKGSVMSGWIPVFDTMHGIRGEVNVIVKVELFNDFNKFRQSSCGVQFFHSPVVPHGYVAQAIHGFVEELVINDDPEYQWIDKIRTPRASNEARQVAFLKLNGQVQRKIGLKALELGANAVIGFRRCLDLEGDVGVVARGAGTAVTLIRQQEPPSHIPNGAVNVAASPDTLAQQLRKYIDFLNTDNNNPQDPASTLSNRQVATILNVLSPSKSVDALGYAEGESLFRDPSYQKINEWRHRSATDVRADDDLSEENALKFLLKQEDMRHVSAKNPLSRGILNLKTSSQNILSKKMLSLKGKRPDSEDEDDADRVSISSHTSTRSIRLPFSDIRYELKKKARFKQSGVKRSLSGGDGNAMAALLVRSVMQAHSSLDCIKESHETSSPVSTLRRESRVDRETAATLVEHSAPNLAIVIDSAPPTSESERGIGTDPDRLQSHSMDNISLNSNGSGNSESNGRLSTTKRATESCPGTPGVGLPVTLLKLPEDRGTFYGSSLSANTASSDEYSSSDDEDNSEEMSDRNKVDGDGDLDTVSLVVKSVMEHRVDDKIISHMEEILGNMSPSGKELAHEKDSDMGGIAEKFSNCDQTDKSQCMLDSPIFQNDKYFDKNDTQVTEAFENIPEEIDQLEERVIESSVIPEISDFSKIFHIGDDDLETPFDDHFEFPTVHDEDRQSKYSSSRKSSHVRPHGLLDSALQTILIDRVNTLNPSCSPSISPQSAASTPSAERAKKSRFHFPALFRRQSSAGDSSWRKWSVPSLPSLTSLTKKKKQRTFSAGDGEENPGLVTTAMQTMLMEKVNIMGEIIANEPIIGDEEHIHANRARGLSSAMIDSASLAPELSRRSSNSSVDLEPSVSKSLFRNRSFVDNPDDHSLFTDPPRETVLGSPFVSLYDLKHADDDHPRRVDLFIGSDCSSRSSLRDGGDNDFPDSLSCEIDPRNRLLANISTNVTDKMDYSVNEKHSNSLVKNEYDWYTPIESDIHIIESKLEKIPENDKTEVKQHSDNYLHEKFAVIEESGLYHAHCEMKFEDDNNSISERALITEIEVKFDSSNAIKCESVNEEYEDSLETSRPADVKMASEPSEFKYQSSRGNSLTAGGAVLRPTMNQESIDMLEYPFLTIIKFPPGFILHIGGAVAARSVKLLERVPNPEEPSPRDAWWSELRTEVRSHMRALRCNAVLAYQETAAICDDVCVLSATGTAAVIDLHPSASIPPSGAPPGSSSTAATVKVKSEPVNTTNGNSGKTAEADASRAELTQTSSLDRTDFEKNEQPNAKPNTDNNNRRRGGGGGERCGPCHVPYVSGSVPYRVSVSKCALCKKGRVPSVVLCSIEPVEGLAVVGRGCLLQAVASRARTPARGEPAARDISDQLPFLEYELHRLLLAKLRVRGMNAIFGLKTTIAVGAGVVAAVGVGTGVLLAALGAGVGGPRLRAAPGDPRHLQQLQQKLDDALLDNRNVYQLHADQDPNGKAVATSDTEESDEELPDMDLGAGNKDTCVLEVDDAEDLEVLRVLTEARPPAGLHVVNAQSVPGLLGEGLVSVRNLQMFTQLWRAKLSSPPGPLHPHFHRLLLSVYFKLRRMVPCAVCDLRFRLDLPEADEIQLVVTGMAVGLGEVTTAPGEGKAAAASPLRVGVDALKKSDGENASDASRVKKSESSELIFTLEEESTVEVNGPSKLNVSSPPASANTQGAGSWRPGVDMTPLAGVPGAKVERYLGNLDFVFVRESTSIRELGGLSGFLHSFITEVLAVVRAHVTALGGNAIVAFYMTELILSDSPHKNQAQCLVSVGGDVVFVSYFPAE